VRVVDTDAPSYSDCSPKAVIQIAEVQKKGKYSLAYQASFILLVFSVDGVLG